MMLIYSLLLKGAPVKQDRTALIKFHPEYVLNTVRSQNPRQRCGSEQNYWDHNPFLHPIGALSNPYYLEHLHEKDRPYPITSPAFSNVPLIGPFLAATLGKLVKPPVRMHTAERDEKDYTLYSSRLEPRGPQALAPEKPQEEFSLWHAFKREVFTMTDFIGLPGFIMRSAYNAAYYGS
jgi:hypothetical protein